MGEMKTTVTQNGRELTFTRIFDAPRELVFEVFSTAEHLSEWWGTPEWPVAECDVDFRVGGVWQYCLRNSNGEEHWGKSVYDEIDPPTRIKLTDYFIDADGKVLGGMPTVKSTVEFEDLGGKTRLVTRNVYDSEEGVQTVVRMGIAEGTNASWNLLEEHLKELV